MKYPYIVVYNGKWYRAGEDVPIPASKSTQKTEGKKVAEIHERASVSKKTEGTQKQNNTESKPRGRSPKVEG